MNENKHNELKELMGVQKPAKDKFDEYCLMLEQQYDPKTEIKQFNANKKLVQSIRGMYIDYEDVEKSNVELGSGAFGVAYKGTVSPTSLIRPGFLVMLSMTFSDEMVKFKRTLSKNGRRYQVV